MKTGGDHCGVLRISAEIFRIVAGTNEVSREVNCFDKYVKPKDGVIWSQYATEVHGLHADHIDITSASNVQVVWGEFEEFLETMIGQDQCGILVVWNGQSCDMEWIYRLTQSPNSSLNMPRNIKDFIDPMKVIKHYKSCKLNSKHSKLETFSLSSV